MREKVQFSSPSRIRCPLLVVACEGEQTALFCPAIRAAGKAPDAEVVRVPGGHYEPFLGAHERVVEAELDFLRRKVVAGSDLRAAA